MEFLFLLIILPFIIGIMFAMGVLTLAAIGFTIVSIAILAVRFWYFVLAAMLIMLFPALYSDNLLGWILVPIIVFAVVMWFIPVPDAQKADYEKAKAEFKASWNNLISKT
ncbi:hypothetical protein [Avibacterium sp. 20-129]|uniref:hypothetical protein n=1 Tax=Avibacterium sp. 20-129 TaxID=2911525 RepID=UPI0022453A2D|nr:hypothetical protein [Avibacterium sp. 20-129]MCW9699832.1 hypothetical protein [Avibacterium sp. 20-129]